MILDFVLGKPLKGYFLNSEDQCQMQHTPKFIVSNQKEESISIQNFNPLKRIESPTIIN